MGLEVIFRFISFVPLFLHVFLHLQVQPNFLPMKEWVFMVFDTLLVIVDSHYQPRGRLFSWFYYVSLRNKEFQKIQGLTLLVSIVYLKSMIEYDDAQA